MTNTLDLLYKKYKQLRDIVGEKWHEQYNVHLSNSEWGILNAIFEGATSIPEVMQKNEISKQAAHKFIKNLEEKQLIVTELIKAPKVQRKIELTQFGLDIYEESLQVQKSIEQQIEQKLGEENYNQLVRILKKPWL